MTKQFLHTICPDLDPDSYRDRDYREEDDPPDFGVSSVERWRMYAGYLAETKKMSSDKKYYFKACLVG